MSCNSRKLHYRPGRKGTHSNQSFPREESSRWKKLHRMASNAYVVSRRLWITCITRTCDPTFRPRWSLPAILRRSCTQSTVGCFCWCRWRVKAKGWFHQTWRSCQLPHFYHPSFIQPSPTPKPKPVPSLPALFSCLQRACLSGASCSYSFRLTFHVSGLSRAG